MSKSNPTTGSITITVLGVAMVILVVACFLSMTTGNLRKRYCSKHGRLLGVLAQAAGEPHHS